MDFISLVTAEMMGRPMVTVTIDLTEGKIVDVKKTAPVSFDAKRAEEIFAAAKEACKGFPLELSKGGMTAGERAYVVQVWDTMPGHTCFMDAFNRIRKGRA